MDYPNEKMNCSMCQHCYPYKKLNPVYSSGWERGYCCVMWTRDCRVENTEHAFVLGLEGAPQNEMCECWEERDG